MNTGNSLLHSLKVMHIFMTQKKNYKNNLMKDNIWKQIALATSKTVPECQRLWKTLRDRFSKERRRTLPSGTGGSSVSPEWEYMHCMRFYEKCLIPRKTTSNVTKVLVEPTLEFLSQELHFEIVHENEELNTTQNEISAELSQVEQEQQCIEQNPSNKRQNEATSSTPIKRENYNSNKGQDDVGEIIAAVQSIANCLNTSQMSKNEAFAKYVQQSLDGMPAQEAKQLRLQIVNLIEQHNIN